MSMWNLKPLTNFDGRAHLDIAFSKGELTGAEKNFLMELYTKYQAALGRPSDTLLGDGQRPELYHLVHDAYEFVQDNRKLKKLRADLKLLADYCPYCGFAPISHLDHHLQKNRYKLLSIFALNLVPCCEPCNTGKRRLPSENPAEHQIHTYLEPVTHFDFLRATAEIHHETGALKVSYSIEQSEGMTDELYLRLQEHLNEFGLHEKYKKQVNIHLSEHIFAFRMTYKSGVYLLREYLNGTANAHKENFGINDWRTALFRGLVKCDDFCNGGFERALGTKTLSPLIPT